MTTVQAENGAGRWGTRATVAAIVVLGALLPVILYWVLFGRAASVSPEQARQFLAEHPHEAVLVDVSAAKDFHRQHLDGAVNWPLQEILALRDPREVPEPLRERRLLLICHGGLNGARAAQHLDRLGVPGVLNVRGGMQEWIATAQPGISGRFQQFRTASGEALPLPFRESPVFEQAVAVVSGFFIKPLYTLLSLVVMILLWRKKEPDLAALRWAMLAFFLGENACAANYLIYGDGSYALEYLHSLGMLICFGFTTYALFEGIDSRMLMLSDPKRKCAALSLCRGCVKYGQGACGLKRMFYLIIPALIVICLMPLSADWHLDSYGTDIFGTCYAYWHPALYQLFERWYCPAAAIVLLSVCWLVLLLKQTDPLPWAKIFFSAATGALGFGFFRLVLVGVYSQNLVWFSFWEEATELLFITGVCYTLWVFREGLFRSRTVNTNEDGTDDGGR